MKYAAIKLADCANGIGCRTVLFVSGCTHHCKGCFQPETWDFEYGRPFTEETEKFLLKETDKPYVDGITVLGGEPMEVVNQKAIIPLLKKIKKIGKSIWIYSGYTWEELNDPTNKRCHGPYTKEILRSCDVLVDGEFKEELRDITLKFRGSSNQRILNLKKSAEQKRPVLLEL